jgi:hypothetical protein
MYELADRLVSFFYFFGGLSSKSHQKFPPNHLTDWPTCVGISYVKNGFLKKKGGNND